MTPRHCLPVSALIAVAVLATACASNESRIGGREIRIRHAEVAGVQRVALPSAAPAGAIVGGFTGLVLSSGRSTRSQVASGIGGAALGALATRALEGDRRGYEYTLRYDDDTESRFITEKGFLQVGDCVAVERGEYPNLRRVDSARCTGIAKPSVRSYLEAEQCQEAKKLLLDANGREEIEDAAKKVEVLCAF